MFAPHSPALSYMYLPCRMLMFAPHSPALSYLPCRMPSLRDEVNNESRSSVHFDLITQECRISNAEASPIQK